MAKDISASHIFNIFRCSRKWPYIHLLSRFWWGYQRFMTLKLHILNCEVGSIWRGTGDFSVKSKTEMRRMSSVLRLERQNLCFAAGEWLCSNHSFRVFSMHLKQSDSSSFNLLVLSSWNKILNEDISEFWGNSGPSLSHLLYNWV